MRYRWNDHLAYNVDVVAAWPRMARRVGDIAARCLRARYSARAS